MEAIGASVKWDIELMKLERSVLVSTTIDMQSVSKRER